MRNRASSIFPALLLLVLTVSGLQAQIVIENTATTPAPEAEKSSEAEDVEKFETNQVLVNVTVVDGLENYVAGLKARDFQVFEDTKPQRIVGFGFEETPFAAAILFDISGSMTHKMSLARAACAQFAERIREGDSVAIYTFGGIKVTKVQDFSEVRDVDPAVWELRADGNTPLYDAIVQASTDLSKRPEKRRALIILSDGADTTSKASLDKARRQAHDANVLIYAVDLSDATVYKNPSKDAGAKILKDMAARTGGRLFEFAGGNQLRDAFTQTVEELRHQYTLVYEPEIEIRDGRWHTIEVRVGKAAYKVRARQGYYAPKAQKK
ncbi:MAG TPA: VWA domain-containing protein [Blastocatellia bacterium]|nr:VWA domain-containing protein [Blastocatellia bacterium]